MVYPALLPLMRTPRLPVVDWTDAPAGLNGLVRFAERRNLISARVPSLFTWPLLHVEHSFVWTLRKVLQKYFKSFDMWFYRRMEKISWTDHMGIEVLQGIKEERSILQTMRRRQGNWLGHILHRNWLLKQVIEGKIEARTSNGKTRKKT